MRAAALLLAAAVPLACGDAGSGAGRDAADQPLRPDPGPPPTLVEGPLIDHVDPFIATGGVGFGVGSALPGATAPFGLVKVSPDTTSPNGRPGWSHCAGYAYGDPLIVGFTHTHMHGTGVPDYGNILFLPAAVEPGGRPPARDEAVPYDKASEAAAAGYYAVTLDDGTRVELTASSRAAVHRYTFPEGTEELLLVDVLAAIPDGRVPESDLDLRPADRLVEGWAHNDGPITQRSGGLSVFFSASFNRPFYPHPDEPTVLRFQPGEGPVVVHVGLSFVDLEGARRNREAEVEGRDFDEVRAATEASWEAELGRIRVAGGSPDDLVILYTAIYHALQMPTLFSDVDGRYPGFDGEIHEAVGFRYHTDLSLWDTYRTLHPLMALVWPDRQLDFIRSLGRMLEEGGYVPKWPAGAGYSSTMLGTSADIVIAGSYLKGIRDFDIEALYAGLMATADAPTPPGAPYGGRSCVGAYIEHGFCPSDVVGGSVSRTLEYGWDDWALAGLAEALGHTGDAERLRARSLGYKHLYNPDFGFLQGRNADGSWVEIEDAYSWTDDYVEGNAWQHLWLVPHDVDGLADLLGGRKAAVVKLDEFFTLSRSSPDTALYDPYYWHGNEPDIHAPFVHALLGRHDKTAENARWVLESKYTTGPDGLDGNDDGGTLSAWWIFAAMGIYPIAGTPTYIVGSPIFERTVIERPDGASLEILAPGASDEALYVEDAWLGDAPLANPWLSHDDLISAGGLLLRMAEVPGDWGRRPD